MRPQYRFHDDRARRSTAANDAERAAGAELLKTLLHLYSSARLTAKQFCVTCRLCEEAGARGGCFSKYSRKDNLQSGKYQEHLDRVLPKPDHIYPVPAPQNVNRRPHRSNRSIDVKLAYESLADEVFAQDDTFTTLRAPADAREQCVLDLPVYNNHPLVVAARAEGRDLPVPIALYVDGVSYRQTAAGRTDSVTGWWVVNLLTGKRHLQSTVRKSDECLCGCRGWCTMHPIMSAIAWQLRALATGKRPTRTHTGKPWPVGQEPAALDLGFTACCVYVKGDWGEHSKTLGLAPPTQLHNPCQFCELSKGEIHSLDHLLGSPGGPPWPLRSASDYEAAVGMCEITVSLESPEDLKKLSRALKWLKPDGGKRTAGIRTRGLTRDLAIGGANLRAGDRLEPSEVVADIGDLRGIECPCELKFWRTRIGIDGHPMDSINHRNPIFARDLGIDPTTSLAIDSMHCVYLGLIQRWASAAIWRILLRNVTGVRGTQDHIINIGLQNLTASLRTWQQAEHVDHSNWINAITIKMIGKARGYSLTRPDHPGAPLKLKAAECGLILKFLLFYIRELGGADVFGPSLIGAGHALEDFLQACRDEPCVVSDQGCQRMLDAISIHNRCCKAAGVQLTPKHHLACHLAARTRCLLTFVITHPPPPHS